MVSSQIISNGSYPKKILRRNRINNGKKMIDAGEIQKLLNAATLPLRAMILLGINAGMGNSDCANLSKFNLDFETGFLDYPRIKTAVERSCYLWPETISAIKEYLEQRPIPKDPDHEGLVFITKNGLKYVRVTDARVPIDAVKDGFDKSLNKTKLRRKGLSFYSLRHTFQTVAEECKDFPAIKHVMGHSDPSMSAVYREEISENRLKTVTDTVREWLWGT